MTTAALEPALPRLVLAGASARSRSLPPPAGRPATSHAIGPPQASPTQRLGQAYRCADRAPRPCPARCLLLSCCAEAGRDLLCTRLLALGPPRPQNNASSLLAPSYHTLADIRPVATGLKAVDSARVAGGGCCVGGGVGRVGCSWGGEIGRHGV